MRGIGIDFGTTNSSIAFARQGNVQLATFTAGVESFRSILYAESQAAQRSRWFAGPEAISEYLDADAKARTASSKRELNLKKEKLVAIAVLVLVLILNRLLRLCRASAMMVLLPLLVIACTCHLPLLSSSLFICNSSKMNSVRLLIFRSVCL